MKKTFNLLLAVVMVLSLLAACSSPAASPTEEAAKPAEQVAEPTEEPAPEPTAEPAVEGKVVEDELGREVVIPENPERILGLTSAVIESLFDLGLTPVGRVEEYKIREEGMALPSIGLMQDLNMEALYDLEPDLIIASSRFHASIEEELVGSGAVVYFFDPNQVGDIPVVELRQYLGNLLGKEAEGEAFVSALFATSKELKAKTEAAGIETGVVMKMGESVLCAQSACGFGSMLNLLGIGNIVPDDLPNASKSSFVKYDAEKIVTDNPDVIILLPVSKEQDANKQMLQEFKNDEKWVSLGAVKNNMVFVAPFPANPNRSGPAKMLQLFASILPLE